ncbi:MAG TPA: phosphomethylpyrimidine synthase ThiC, partial [Candidatus Deferrimicrobiaceae bacterium]|nr:phosphomethylpyrimidine synthase ThiC [Candidatus Deferrimicrobiaceae bacterium]
MTLLRRARSGALPGEISRAAAEEGLPPEKLRESVAGGRAVIPRNRKRRELRPVAIGEGLRIKINANVGSSRDRADVPVEIEKMRVAVEAGADAVMDLSTGGPLRQIRRRILGACPVPVGTVPIYEAAVEAVERGKSPFDLSAEDLFRVIEAQAREGVDFMTVHCGITLEGVARLESHPRLLGVVSR